MSVSARLAQPISSHTHTGYTDSVPICPLTALATWPPRRWLVAAATGLVTFLLLGLSTAVIPNPVFGRSVAPTDWAMEVLVATSVLTGLLTATYVATGRADGLDKRGTVGALLAYFAIGCPVCNKLALIALGASGALQFFAPVQPYLAVAGLGVLGWALMVRLRGEMTCAFTPSLRSNGMEDVHPGGPAGGQGGRRHSDDDGEHEDQDHRGQRDHQDLDSVAGQ